jgi:glycosyltransferase involved in cell wall biosynthesis
MRILLTADPMLPVPPVGYGGIERIVAALAAAYQERGHTVQLMAKAGSTASVAQLHAWPHAPDTTRSATIQNALALRRACVAFRPDVLHSFSRLGYLLPVLGARRATIMSYQRHTGGARLKWVAKLGGRNLHFTGCSDFICNLGRAAGGEWTSIPNFVEPAKITFVSSVPANAPLVFLSRVESIKGAHLAIAIAQRARRALVIAGNRARDGVEADYWDREIAPHLGRNGVDYIGEVDDRRKNDLLGRAAALLVPIQWDEPFGIVFVEAMAAGTPVITCARGATPEIVTPGRTGTFIKNVEEGVAAVQRVSQLDRAACRRTVEERFSVDVCATRYLGLYEQRIAAVTGA